MATSFYFLNNPGFYKLNLTVFIKIDSMSNGIKSFQPYSPVSPIHQILLQ